MEFPEEPLRKENFQINVSHNSHLVNTQVLTIADPGSASLIWMQFIEEQNGIPVKACNINFQVIV